ncbi:MAG: prepilin-type N-terminal cleavage/methylation domain-containing protein [Thermodesulfobacteriota bacterium]
MSTHKGFTILELLLAVTVTVVLMALVMPFFIAQSTFSYNSSQGKSTGESVELALLLIKRDLLQAGYGVKTNPCLAVYVVDGNPDTLYINYSGYMNSRGDVEALPTETGLQQSERAFLGANNVFQEDSRWAYPSGTLTYQGRIRVSGAALQLVGVPTEVTSTSIGAFIYKTDATSFDYADGAVDVDVKACYDAQAGAGAAYTNSCIRGESVYGDEMTNGFRFQTMTLNPQSSITGKLAAPAISYRVVEAGLWRNRGVSNNPWGVPILGEKKLTLSQPALLEVTGFDVRCQFQDIAGNTLWSPDNGVFGAGSLTAANLKQVEVTITFRTKMRSGGMSAGTIWSSPRSRTITVSPRTVALKTGT